MQISSILNSISTSRIIKNIASTFGTRVFTGLIGTLTAILLARLLGPEKQGVYSVVLSFAAIGIQVCNLGMPASNTYYLSKKTSILPVIVGNSLFFSLSIGCIYGFILVPILLSFPNYLEIELIYVPFILVIVPFGVTHLLLQNILIGLQLFKFFNMVEIFSKVVPFFIIMFLAYSDSKDVFLLLWVSIGILFFSSLLTLFYLFKDRLFIPCISLNTILEHFRYGFKSYISCLCAFLILRVDLLMINSSLGLAEAGFYSIAAGLANTMYFIPSIIGLIIFPELCKEQSIENKWKLVNSSARVVLIVMSIFIMLGVIISDDLIVLFYGTDYRSSSVAFICLLPGILIFCIESTYRKFFVSEGYNTNLVLTWVTAVIANILLNYLLIPIYGIKGAAIASSITFFCLAGSNIALVYKPYFVRMNSLNCSQELS